MAQDFSVGSFQSFFGVQELFFLSAIGFYHQNDSIHVGRQPYGILRVLQRWTINQRVLESKPYPVQFLRETGLPTVP